MSSGGMAFRDVPMVTCKHLLWIMGSLRIQWLWCFESWRMYGWFADAYNVSFYQNTQGVKSYRLSFGPLGANTCLINIMFINIVWKEDILFLGFCLWKFHNCYLKNRCPKHRHVGIHFWCIYMLAQYLQFPNLLTIFFQRERIFCSGVFVWRSEKVILWMLTW